MLPRAPLYGRYPAAAGTGFVESLSSYVARLCVARSVSVVDVFDVLVRPLVPDGLLKPRGYLSFYLSHDSVALDGVGSRTRHFVAAFEQLTDCPDLHLHTFLPWRLLFCPRSSLVLYTRQALVPALLRRLARAPARALGAAAVACPCGALVSCPRRAACRSVPGLQPRAARGLSECPDWLLRAMRSRFRLRAVVWRSGRLRCRI